MRKRLLGSLGICLALLASTISSTAAPAVAAEEVTYPYWLSSEGDVSCAAPQTCSAITYGSEVSIIAWDGIGNTFKSAIEIDLTANQINKKILDNNDIKLVVPVALTCMSVGNCVGLLRGLGDAEEKTVLKDGSKTIGVTSRTTIKPYKTIYFSISQIDSKWQTPKYIETLTFSDNNAIVPLTSHASIFCASHGNCVVAGNSSGPTEERIKKAFGKHVYGEMQLDAKPFFISQVNGVWGNPQFPMAKKLQNQGASFFTLKCSSISDCVVQGGYVPAPDLLNKLKLQNNFTKGVQSVHHLGFTLNLANGNWAEPKSNLGFVFKKGPFPKGDPKVYLYAEPYKNVWNSTTNMMPCLKTSKCVLTPVIAEGQIQPAGVGNASWPVKCPRVVDSVQTPQPKVLGFKFDGSGETYTRLADGTSTASKVPGDLVGCYAVLNWFIPNPKDANSYHIGTINRDASGYYWQNPDGGRWRLTLSGSILTTDRNNPYYDEGRQFITF